jgi:hypothetical protein
MKKFALANEEQIFLKKEYPEGVLVYPAATDLVLATGAAATNQENEFIEDAQKRNRRSRMSPIMGRINPGAWSFSTYVKPSGSLGVAPETDVLWECAFGKKTPHPGASIVYSLDSSSNLPSFSMLRKVGHTIFFMAGNTVNVCEITVAGNEIASVAWSGEFMKWWMAGEAELTTQCQAGDDHCHINDARRFSDEKVKIVIGTNTNSGDGYLVTSVDYDTNIINFSPVLIAGNQNIGAAVKGWYPSSGVETGKPVHGKLGDITINDTRAVILSSKITLTNNIKYYTDMKSGLLYPTVYGAPGFRDAVGTLQLYFYKDMPNYFYRAAHQMQDELIIQAGNVAGKKLELSCPRIEYKTPTISGDEEVMIELNFTAIGSASGDDEITATFK